MCFDWKLQNVGVDEESSPKIRLGAWSRPKPEAVLQTLRGLCTLL